MIYQVGSFIFELAGAPIPMPENMKKFQVFGKTPQYRYEFEIVDEIRPGQETFLVRKEQIRIAVDGDLETRYLNLIGEECPYAVSRERSETLTQIQVAREKLPYFTLDVLFVSMLSLERRMAQLGGFVLHSCYVEYQGEAILFTAPSGTGKSTQGDLWKKYRGAEVRNGDRCLLECRDGRLWAEGWPICGSSGICENRSVPVRAVVLLEQARENRVKQLSSREYTRRLMREITINYHNEAFFAAAIAFLEEMQTKVQMLHLGCNISEEAVATLEKALDLDGA